MLTDTEGHALTGANNEALAAYTQAVTAFQLYRGDPMASLDQAYAAAPECTMVHIMKAHLLALATEPQCTVMAQTLMATLKTLTVNPREASHRAVIEQVLAGEWSAAALAMDQHNLRYPYDILALQVGHLIDFFRANARNLRDRIARVLPHWSTDMPGYSVLLGMHAFGLEETGDYARAEAVGREALSLQPLDCWAHHAVAHVMEMQGRAEDGIGWMIAREPYWSGDDNFFKIHNAWHGALCHLELGQMEAALALYDRRIRDGQSAVVLDMIDASALLWRLQLTGCDVGTRWDELVQAWDAHADGLLYPFNDWHGVMAYLGAGRFNDVERVRAALQSAGGRTEAARWASATGLALVEGFTAYWQGDYATAVERLFRARPTVNQFGGSHAQRDIIDWTLIEAVLRGRMRGMAEALAHERRALKAHSPFNYQLLVRARTIDVRDVVLGQGCSRNINAAA